MPTETLFYKEHLVSDRNVDIIFHTDFTHIYNETTTYPLVKFSLINCRDLESVKFDCIDHYNDGAEVDIENDKGLTVFRTKDQGGIIVEIICDEVQRENIAYRSSDLIGIIKAIQYNIDHYRSSQTKCLNRIQHLTNSLKHDIDVIERRLVKHLG